MEYIASSVAGVYHASTGREKRPSQTAVGGQGWHWQAKAVCGRTVTGISGNAVVSQIDCERCLEVLKREGWEI